MSPRIPRFIHPGIMSLLLALMLLVMQCPGNFGSTALNSSFTPASVLGADVYPHQDNAFSWNKATRAILPETALRHQLGDTPIAAFLLMFLFLGVFTVPRCFSPRRAPCPVPLRARGILPWALAPPLLSR